MKKLMTLGLLALLVLPIVIAYQTDITVVTNPKELVSINVYDSRSDDLVYSIFERADESGMFSRLVSTGAKELDIKIKSQDNKNVIIGKWEAESYEAGIPINLNFIQEEVNESVEENTSEENENATEEILVPTQNETDESRVTATGQSVLGKINPANMIYYIVGIVLVLAIVFVSFGLKKKRGAYITKGESPREKEIKVRALSDVLAEQKQMRESVAATNRNENDVAAIEQKIKEAQMELNRLKNADKIKATEMELARKQEELERMRRGEL